MSELPLMPDQPSATDQVRRFGPPAMTALVAVLFIVQNTETATFSFLWFEFRWPLWIMLVVFMAVGAVVASGVARRRARTAARNS